MISFGFLMKDVGLENLLALDGTEYTEEIGYWYKIEAFLVEPTEERPHASINDKGTPYEFESAEQLLRDFFQEVNSIIQKLNNGDKK